MSATFHQPGYDHLVELVHQRDRAARRRLASLDVAAYDPEGKMLAALPVDTGQEILDLDALLAGHTAAHPRVMVLFDARYDEAAFGYRPHHYGFLHRRGEPGPPLYYAVSGALGGVPDRIEAASRLNNFETYLFRRRPFAGTCSVMLGNLSRFADAEAQVISYHGAGRTARTVTVPPKAHVEVALAAERDGARLRQVEVKALFRLASYVVGRRAGTGALQLFDHMFTYFK
ncbi:MAG TPA: hypothetical protein VFX28_13875 [Methylomirabilota bacterium]|nr:hypothetical protein [Methylomirabilota bacterium]